MDSYQTLTLIFQAMGFVVALVAALAAIVAAVAALAAIRNKDGK
ncbi:hypothetical protein [Desulfocurvus sp.]|nr:hypothetical protein [Desulfocurvus sp.]